jgi:PAS domain S-box-containing protein
MDTLDAVPAKSSSRTLVRGLCDAVRADWLAYVFALAAPCVVFWLHLALGLTTVLSIQLLGAHAQGNLRGFVLFLVAVILSTYLGGLGPGLLSTFVAAGLIGLLQHLNGVYLTSWVDLWRLVAFMATGVLVSVLMEGQQRRKRQRLASHRFRDVTLASIGDGVITADEMGNTTFLNSEAERLTGWENHQAVGRPLSDVFHVIDEQTRGPEEDPVKMVLRLGATTRFTSHTLLVNKNGREIPITESAAPIMPPDGKLEGFVLVFRDGSESRKAEAELQRRLQLQEQIAHIVNTAPALIYSFRQRADGTTCFPFASPWIEEILGASTEELAKDGALAARGASLDS